MDILLVQTGYDKGVGVQFVVFELVKFAEKE